MPLVEKKIAELEMGLLHLQQNIDIPEITLTFHPFVVGIVKKCNAEGRKPSPEDFSDKVEDSTFLNALQHGVNRWIREIQKVWKISARLNKPRHSFSSKASLFIYLYIYLIIHILISLTSLKPLDKPTKFKFQTAAKIT